MTESTPEDPELTLQREGTRQVSFNGAMLREKDLLGSVEAILAHEIGHHVFHSSEDHWKRDPSCACLILHRTFCGV